MIFEGLSGFTKRVIQLLKDEHYAELQIALVRNPELGKVIKHSGGVRVIYYWWVAEDVITLADIYAKNEKEDLSPDEIKALRRQIEGG